MPFENIIVDWGEGICTITLNQPRKLNAFTQDMLMETAQVIQEAAENDEVKALILTGAGRGFSSGADFSRPPRILVPESRTLYRQPYGRFGLVAHRLRQLEKPSLAAINGTCAGVGLSYALACDIRIASEDAVFSSIFVKRGLIGGSGLTYLLPRVVGVAKSLEMMWTGDIIGAREAEQIGLVGQVVPAKELMPATRALAMKLVKGPSVAIELIKRMAYQSLETDNFEAHLAAEAWAQGLCRDTEDFQEGVASFREKREPVFRGK